MKRRFSKILILLTLLAILFSLFALTVSAAKITTAATGYTSADQVDYEQSGGYIANWGARGEVASFLSTYAQAFYKGEYVYDVLSEVSGGTGQSNAPSSQLYNKLKTLMTSKHTHQTSYSETKNQYRYTDCVSNNTNNISSFYSGRVLTGSWDGAATWNREHTWPNSKGLGGNDENDIMMLRPTWVQENSSRGNTAYGESGSYFDPGESTRGDCARICLYVYVRWGNTGKMWGTGGVMENLDVLLRWMEEDPVDTWEMGRNDAVQSITGTRNVFVDYPEYAWLLFGRQMPDDLQSPSGEGGNACRHQTQITGAYPATCTTPGFTGNTVCTICGATVKAGTVIPASHSYSAWTVTVEATCTASGTKTRECSVCHNTNTATIAATGHSMGSWIPISSPVCESAGEAKRECANCDYCETQFVNPTGHTLGDWITLIAPTCENSGSAKRECQNCDFEESKVLEPTGHTLVYIPYQAPTKTSVGWEAYEKCNSCSYTTYKEIPKIIDISEFVKAVGEVDVTAYPVVLYEQIEKAKSLYKELSDDEKALASKEIATLNSAIDAYNLMVEDVNAQHADTLKTAFAPITVCFVFLSLFISFIEKHFKP